MLVKNDEFLNDGCRTPPWLFSALDDQVRALTGRGFQLDAAACQWNAQCRFYFDERIDARRQDWSPYSPIYCNPQFHATLIDEFVPKGLEAADHGCTVVFLVPYWQDYRWFQQLKKRGQMQDILGPVDFERRDGTKFVRNKGPHAKPLVVFTLGPHITPGTNGDPIRKSAAPSSLPKEAFQPQIPPGLDRALTELPVLTSYQGNTDYLMAQVARLYFRPGDRIADVTYGQGVFWRRIDLTQFDFHPSDLLTVPEHPYDCRCLPHRSADFDVHVFDPPYIHHPRARRYLEAAYRNHETTKGFCHDDILRLFQDGMVEGYRILKPGGLMVVRCRDEIESGRQKMTHIEIYDIAVSELRMRTEELFILTHTNRALIPSPLVRQHAWKNHSYLWVFKKPAP